MSELAVHPVAALFPMLADDELGELAADIKARGLLRPIVPRSASRLTVVLHLRMAFAVALMKDVGPDSGLTLYWLPRNEPPFVLVTTAGRGVSFNPSSFGRSARAAKPRTPSKPF
jgi:hypothetical protein